MSGWGYDRGAKRWLPHDGDIDGRPPAQRLRLTQSAVGVGAAPFQILFVAEKPSIAKMLAQALSTCAQRGRYTEEYSMAGATVPVFCVDTIWRQAVPEALAQAPSLSIRITSTVGHMYSAEFPALLRRWKGVDPQQLFDAPVEKLEPNDGKSCIPQHLAAEASRCHAVVLWLDCDREGESICYEVLASVLPHLAFHPLLASGPASSWNRNLQLDLREEEFHNDPRVWRARFSSLHPRDLLKAFGELQKPNPWEARAVDARQEIDLKVGVALTRLITTHLRDSVADLTPSRQDGKGPMISYGPCQTPALGFCVSRWDAIQKFNKESSFTIDAYLASDAGAQGDAGAVRLRWNSEEGRRAPGGAKGAPAAAGGSKGVSAVPPLQHSRQEVEHLIAQVPPDATATVVAAKRSQRRVERPKALNTVGMLKAASRELGMDPHSCMQVAERLYTSGLLTYPRTETSRYPPSMDVVAMVQDHAWHPKWGAWCQHLMQGRMQQASSGQDVGDHPPITPVQCASEEQVGRAAGPNGVRLYELVARHFLATVSPDVLCQHYELHFSIGVGASALSFRLSGNEVVDSGFSEVCWWAASHDPVLFKGNLLSGPALALACSAAPGERHSLAPGGGLSIREEESRPPELLSEADLLDLMDTNGIGTDASMAQHVHNLVLRGYVEVLGVGRRMRPTLLGVALVHGLRQVDGELVKPAIRARIESQVSDIAHRRRPFVEVVGSALEIFKAKYRSVQAGMPKLIEEFEWKRKKWRQWRDHDLSLQRPKGSSKGGSSKGSSSKAGSKGSSTKASFSKGVSKEGGNLGHMNCTGMSGPGRDGADISHVGTDSGHRESWPIWSHPEHPEQQVGLAPELQEPERFGELESVTQGSAEDYVEDWYPRTQAASIASSSLLQSGFENGGSGPTSLKARGGRIGKGLGESSDNRLARADVTGRGFGKVQPAHQLKGLSAAKGSSLLGRGLGATPLSKGRGGSLAFGKGQARLARSSCAQLVSAELSIKAETCKQEECATVVAFSFLVPGPVFQAQTDSMAPSSVTALESCPTSTAAMAKAPAEARALVSTPKSVGRPGGRPPPPRYAAKPYSKAPELQKIKEEDDPS
ncbi:unnamed protein product [Polarella glacialis]|uniref:DNA topoisomerase n=1 Tax=Polarella glacialis TaxID=89957 RepID=A0A813EPA0_POLGL|nr:unnamed protein product [Polarella glacialis]